MATSSAPSATASSRQVGFALAEEQAAPRCPAAATRVPEYIDVHGDGTAVEHDPLRAPGLFGAVAAHRL